MMSSHGDDFERAAGGLDFDDAVRDHAASLGSAIAAEGPAALFDEIEELIPEKWRDQIAEFPLTAVALGVGVGVFLGMKKGSEILAAVSSLIAAAATANLNEVLERKSG